MSSRSRQHTLARTVSKSDYANGYEHTCEVFDGIEAQHTVFHGTGHKSYFGAHEIQGKADEQLHMADNKSEECRLAQRSILAFDFAETVDNSSDQQQQYDPAES